MAQKFTFSFEGDSAVKQYDNKGAYNTLQAMMTRREKLSVKFYCSKDGIPCAWIESNKVAGFTYQLKTSTFQGLLNYLLKNEVTDFDANPMETDTLDDGTNFQRDILLMFINSGKTIQYVPLFRERGEYITAMIPCFKGKIIFKVKRTQETLDTLRELKQAI